MPETNWGRKETMIWPPHKPIFTFGAVFFAVVLTGLFVYLHIALVLTPLQRFYLPIYIKTTIVASVRQSSKYQLLLMADKKGHALYARDVDVVAGSTPQANTQPHPLGFVRFRPPERHGLSLPQRADHLPNRSLVGLFQLPLIFGVVALLALPQVFSACIPTRSTRGPSPVSERFPPVSWKK